MAKYWKIIEPSGNNEISQSSSKCITKPVKQAFNHTVTLQLLFESDFSALEFDSFYLRLEA